MDVLDLNSVRVTVIGAPTGPASGGGGNSGFQTSRLLNVEEAEASAPFAVRFPAFLPEGFRFREAALLTSPKRMVVLTYVGAAGQFGFSILEAPVEEFEAAADGKRDYFVVAESLDEAQVGSARAAAAQLPARPGMRGDVSGLVWEADSLLCHLIGQGLSATALAQIAASI